MSGLRTIKQALAGILLTLATTGAQADLFDPENQLRQFATCAGRLSAQMEFEWMTDGPASEVTAQHRASVIELLDAIMPQGRGHEVLSWRIDAKVAHQALLTRAHFKQEDEDAVWAQRVAQRQTAECTSLLLS